MLCWLAKSHLKMSTLKTRTWHTDSLFSPGILKLVELCHTKTGLKIFVIVIPKEGLAWVAAMFSNDIELINAGWFISSYTNDKKYLVLCQQKCSLKQEVRRVMFRKAWSSFASSLWSLQTWRHFCITPLYLETFPVSSSNIQLFQKTSSHAWCAQDFIHFNNMSLNRISCHQLYMKAVHCREKILHS